MIRRFCVALALLVLLPAASPPADPPTAFGARPGIEHISLSPSGTRIAFIAPGPGQSSILYTVDAAGGVQPREAVIADGNPERIKSCSWVSDSRLTCNIFMMMESGGEIFPVSRVMAVDADGSNIRVISRAARADDAYLALGGGEVIDSLPGEDGAVLMTRVFVPEVRENTNLADRRQGYGVERIDTRTGSARVVEQPKRSVSEYISDGRGNVRIMGVRDVAGASATTAAPSIIFIGPGARATGSRSAPTT